MERNELLAPSFDTLDRLAIVLRRFGRKVEAKHLQPRPQPNLIKGFRAESKHRRTA